MNKDKTDINELENNRTIKNTDLQETESIPIIFNR